LRIPAKELEDAVRTRVAETLDQPLALLAKLHSTLMGIGFRIAMDWASKLSCEIRAKEQATLRSLVRRVEVDAHELRIHLKQRLPPGRTWHGDRGGVHSGSVPSLRR
jgi:hypothetical protein